MVKNTDESENPLPGSIKKKSHIRIGSDLSICLNSWNMLGDKKELKDINLQIDSSNDESKQKIPSTQLKFSNVVNSELQQSGTLQNIS